MPTTRAALALLAIAVAAASPPCRADGDALDPGAVAPAKVGDRRRWRFEESLHQRLERTVAGQPPQTLESFERTDATLADEVQKVADGRPAIVRTTIERWERAAGTSPDGRLEKASGLSRRVAVLDAVAGTWTLEGEPKEVSGAARRFLDRLAGRWRPGGDVAAIDSAFLPARPARAGARWEAAARVAALAPGAPFTAIDPERSKVTALLDELAPAKASTTLEGVLVLLEVPGTSDRFDEGGAARVAGAATWRPGRRPSEGMGALTQSVQGAASGRLPDGLAYRTRASLELTLRWTAEE
ncbi:MAG: hypothetical protein M9894_19515 [Planctomycetes bacterium]|nr:hypothetical protein [Planctomycetota bacterium]